MPRHHRNLVPGVPVHIVQRGNDRQPCFFSDRDRIVFLGKLREYSEKHAVSIHAFVLMDNPVHLLATPGSTEAISVCLQDLGRWYVRYINNAYERTGTLWEGRFRASLIDSDSYFLAVSRYIELNPVRAGMVSRPADYAWSSYRANALGIRIRLLTPHNTYLGLGHAEPERLRNYKALFDQPIADETLANIRNATQKAWVLGDAQFKQKMEMALGYLLPPLRHGGKRPNAGSKGKSESRGSE